MVLGMSPMKEMVKKGRGSGMTWTGLGDLKEWIGGRVRAGINGAFGVPGEDDNGRKVVEFCAERWLCVGNILQTQGWQGAKMEWR